MQGLPGWTAYWWIVLGIGVSLVMPIVRQLAVPPADGIRVSHEFAKRVWITARPYFFMAIFSLMAAFVILAGVRVKTLPIDSKWGAFRLGYFCDATIQKLMP